MVILDESKVSTILLRTYSSVVSRIWSMTYLHIEHEIPSIRTRSNTFNLVYLNKKIFA